MPTTGSKGAAVNVGITWLLTHPDSNAKPPHREWVEDEPTGFWSYFFGAASRSFGPSLDCS